MRSWTKRDPVKNYFPLPNEIYQLGLSHGAIAVYGYLLRIEDRKTYQCHPSYATIGKAVGMSNNTVRKYVQELEERGLIRTERTSIITQDGRKQNGSLLYTILPIQFSIGDFISGRWMLRTGQRNGSEWQDAWNSPACKNNRYVSLRSVAVTEKNRGTYRCEERYSSGAARLGGAAAPAHNGHAPQARIRCASGCYPSGRFSLWFCAQHSQRIRFRFYS